jgi:hypothetical protein
MEPAMQNPYGPPGKTHLSVLMRPAGSLWPGGIGVFRQEGEGGKSTLVAYVSIAEFDRVATIVAEMRADFAKTARDEKP